jgi:hypothetical protein
MLRGSGLSLSRLQLVRMLRGSGLSLRGSRMQGSKCMVQRQMRWTKGMLKMQTQGHNSHRGKEKISGLFAVPF